jgi:hypothetical protein
MDVINAYFGDTLLDVIDRELQCCLGDRFDVGVGYAKNLTGASFERFSTVLASWLDGDERRTFRLFIGDHRHRNDSAEQQKEKIEACTSVVAALSNSARSIEERMEVAFLPKLHAKFYSMWSCAVPNDHLKWAIVGSSNLTDAALNEKNIELDIYFKSGDIQLQTIQGKLLDFIKSAYWDAESWGALHDKINRLTARSRWETGKLRAVDQWKAENEADLQAMERKEAEEQARTDSDQSLGIAGAK